MGLDNATVRFVGESDGRGEGLGGIDLVVNDRDAVLAAAERLGCEFVADDAGGHVLIAGTRMYLR